MMNKFTNVRSPNIFFLIFLSFLILPFTTISSFSGKKVAEPSLHPGTKKIKSAILYDMGGKFDKSFNESASKGVVQFKDETGLDVVEFEITKEAQRELALRRLAKKSDVIAVVGFAYTTPLKTVAPEFPNKKFVIIDSVVDLPNVQSVLFKEHQGSYLVGMLAALKSQTGKIGFVGGQDIPIIRRFELGYIEGAKHINKDIKVLSNMTGSTPAAWNNPTRGGELAKSQIDRGADVIFAAAGPTGLGVYQAAADNNMFAIGVDSNQNHIQPGHMLTSMIKRVDLAVYEAFKATQNSNFKSGIRVLGLKDDGVDYSLDEFNEYLITTEMKDRLFQAKQDIISGKIKVPDYLEIHKKKK